MCIRYAGGRPEGSPYGIPCPQLTVFLLLSNTIQEVSAIGILLEISGYSFLFIVIQIQLSPFPPTTPLHHSQTHFPPLILRPFGFVHVFFIHVPKNPSFFPPSPIIPSQLPSGYCQFVLNFNVSGYILLAFFLLLIRFHL